MLFTLVFGVSMLLVSCQAAEIGGVSSQGVSSLAISSSKASRGGENSSAMVNDSKDEQEIIPLDESIFSQTQLFYINKTKGMYMLGIEIDSPPTEQQKADFFRWIIDSEPYSEKCDKWYDGTIYKIPLSEIQSIIYKHMDTTIFLPEEAFPSLNKQHTKGYDKENNEFVTPMIDGYGGAAALGVMKYDQQSNNINVVIGSYYMPKFFSDVQQYELLETYTVNYMADLEDNSDYKVLSAKLEVPQ